MDDFKVIYKILHILQKAMDLEEFDHNSLSREQFNMSEPKWCRMIAMLVENGYISGIDVWRSFDREYPKIAITRPEITLKGLEYLNENSTMRKISAMAKGAAEIASNILS